MARQIMMGGGQIGARQRNAEMWEGRTDIQMGYRVPN